MFDLDLNGPRWLIGAVMVLGWVYYLVLLSLPFTVFGALYSIRKRTPKRARIFIGLSLLSAVLWIHRLVSGPG